MTKREHHVWSRTPTAVLTPEEIAALAVLVATAGSPANAARAVGIGDTVLAKALLGWPIHRLSATIIRARLAA